MQRRSFLKKASVGAVAGSAAVAAPVFAQDAPTLNWRLASSFTRGLDTLWGTGELFSRYVREGTNGKFKCWMPYKRILSRWVTPVATTTTAKIHRLALIRQSLLV